MNPDADVAGYFVAATAAQLSEGAAGNVYRTAERKTGEFAGEPWRQARFLAERAALFWAPRALRSAGCDVEAGALETLGIPQAGYVARLIDAEYRTDLEPGSHADVCCREAVAALDAAEKLEGVAIENLLRVPATSAGHALVACFFAGGVNSVLDQVAETLDLLARGHRAGSVIAWDL
jgi:hypothetical protein